MSTPTNTPRSSSAKTIIVIDDDFAENKAHKQLPMWKTFILLLSTVLLITWFKHDRLTSYWQQTYQQTHVWNVLNQIPNWSIGLAPQRYLNTSGLTMQLASFNVRSNTYFNQMFYPKLLERQRLLEAEQAKKLAEAKEAARLEAEKRERERLMVKEVTIRPGQKVFFAGDSMMQGVAPWAMRTLQSDYQIVSIDLSKQNTGLSYSTFYDWPATIEQTLLDNPDIGVMAVFLGANDPWAVPDPENPGGKYIDFASPRWNELYSAKIKRIMHAAQMNQTQIIWVTPPLMKSEKLKNQMITLAEIHRQTIPNTEALILDSKPLLLDDPESNEYTDSITIDGSKVKVRTADGIHFTAAGQKRLADAIVSHIKVISDTIDTRAQ